MSEDTGLSQLAGRETGKRSAAAEEARDFFFPLCFLVRKERGFRAPISPRSAANVARLTDVLDEGIGCQDALPPSDPVRDREARTHLAGAQQAPTRTASGSRALAPPVRLSARARLADLPGPPCRALAYARPRALRRPAARARARARRGLGCSLPKLTRRAPGAFKGTGPRAGAAPQAPLGVGARFELRTI